MVICTILSFFCFLWIALMVKIWLDLYVVATINITETPW